MVTPAPDPDARYQREYFETGNYADRGLGRFSMYWFARRYYAALVRRFAPQSGASGSRTDGGSLLEIGVGLGDLLSLLQDDFECSGIDVSSFSVEHARSLAGRATITVGDAGNLQHIAAGSFDVVVALHVVEHLDDPAAAIAEIHRILRPGGLWLFATPNPGYTLRRYKDHATDAIGSDPTHVNVRPPAQWRSWCEDAGFTVLRQFGDGLWDVPYLPRVPSSMQFAVFGLPAFAQVVTRTTWTPLDWGVNQIVICRR
ncbi:MAG: class I SAM-dependent methyltransferase [Ilumatobacter sp.]|uniref:class I SAM-dependent methyltransferase n=1 Tax=Ilumatobacter sp. TaxID=1967498 RepID=UPI00329A70F9